MSHFHIRIQHGIWEWNLVKIVLMFWQFLQRFVQIKLKSLGTLGINMVDLIHVAFQHVLMILNLIKMLLDHAIQIRVKTVENALMMDTIINVNVRSASMAPNVKMVSTIFKGKRPAWRVKTILWGKFEIFCWNFQIFNCTSGWILVIVVD